MPIDDEIAARLHILAGVTLDEVPPPPEVTAKLIAFGEPAAGYRDREADVHERLIPGPHGEIRVRIYRPESSAGSRPGLVWLHGGGFVGGDLDMGEADGVARELCARVGATVVSVEYRLCVDGVHFPVPHDDVVAAWLWTVGAADELGIDPRRLAMGGGSAGGNLAAGAALRLRDEGLPLPSRLLLVYPVLHLELPPLPPDFPADADVLPPLLRLTPENIVALNRNYLGDGVAPTPYAFPALGDLAGLPPTVFLTSEYDDLRASAEAFAEALTAAGVDVISRCERGVPHGHLNIRGIAATDRSLDFLAAELAAT